MKILTLHVDEIEFQATKKALKTAEETDKKPKNVKECLVVLASVEKRDESDAKLVAERLAKEVDDIAQQIKVDKIVLYPYAHLSSDLAAPEKAIAILDESEKILKKGFQVVRAPFGWYKSFKIACKGHPLAELSRSFGPEAAKEESGALASEKKLKSVWHIMDANGKLHEVDKFDFEGHEKLKKFAFYEKEKSRKVVQEPAHVALMKKLELVDYEPASDSGHLRYYPKGRFIKSLLEQYTSQRVAEYGGVEVETPIMYDSTHPSLKSYLDRFPARQYTIQSDKRNFFLRFAACFGQFLIAHDATLSYRNLPLRLYELTRYSFRREQHGELTGMRRLRAFTMPDCHALCADLEQAMKEFDVRFNLCLDIQKKIGLGKEDFELAVRMTKDFYQKNKGFVEGIVKKFGKPVLIEMWDERFFYFILKYELNFVDSMDKASALSTDQIDIENGERYDIQYVDKEGKKHHPLILHCSPTGAIERVIYALLEKAHFAQQAGKKPLLPLWLAPIQVRIIPVSLETHLGFSRKLAEELEKENIRVDIDDNEQSVGKRIRNAEQEWVNYILVVGDNELKGKQLMVRCREKDKEEKMGQKQLIELIHRKTEGMPFKPLPLPLLLSQRPVFVG